MFNMTDIYNSKCSLLGKFKELKKTFLVSLGVCVSVLCSAQNPPQFATVHTPEVTAFNSNIETPVNLYSGVPTIRIPLYTIEMKGVSVPITLNYHAGGVRADQEATWVGLGWSLDYGGMISRIVRGAPDEIFFWHIYGQ